VTERPERLEWQAAEVREIVPETARVSSLVLDVPGWRGAMAAGLFVGVKAGVDEGFCDAFLPLEKKNAPPTSTATNPPTPPITGQ